MRLRMHVACRHADERHSLLPEAVDEGRVERVTITERAIGTRALRHAALHKNFVLIHRASTTGTLRIPVQLGMVFAWARIQLLGERGTLPPPARRDTRTAQTSRQI